MTGGENSPGIPANRNGGPDRRHILTVSVEEYFHGRALSQVVLRKHWDRLESRVDRTMDEVLEFLDRHGARATFFVLGLMADRSPGLVRRIAGAGHEIASRGFWPRGVTGMSEEEFTEDLDRTKAALEAAGGNAILGYRSPRWLDARDLWVLEVLARKGYAYDSSINPRSRRLGSRFAVTGEHRVDSAARGIWEVPVSTASFAGFRFTIGGGNWWRQLPQWLIGRGVESWVQDRRDPLVCYFKPWELDAEQPQVTAVSPLGHLRQYRNLGRTRVWLDRLLGRFRFVSVAEWLELPLVPPTGAGAAVAGGSPVSVIAAVTTRTAISVVVPAFNERDNIAYLLRTMDEVTARLGERYDVELVLVDDGSDDGTWEEMERLAEKRPRTLVLRHDRNRGVAAAILTGIRGASRDIVVSVDCDCSYDPAEIEAMVPLLEHADLVTASPYHPDGHVLNVPRWRLFLSRSLSWIYRRVVGGGLYTWTSCFRVYRKPAVADLSVQHAGFLGVAEFLIRAVRRGLRVVEHPALLESRLLGVSKMKTLRTILGHLGLIGRILLGRVR